MKINWGRLLFSLPLVIITVLAILGGAELVKHSVTARLVAFYGVLMLIITKELYYGLNLFLESIGVIRRRK